MSCLKATTSDINRLEQIFKAASCLILPMIIGSSSTNVHAGAWVPPKHQTYIKLGYQHYEADNFFGTPENEFEFSSRKVSIYGEYGFADNWAMYGTLLFQNMEKTPIDSNVLKSTGFSDAEIGFRYQWLQDPFILSTSLLYKSPSLYDEFEALPRGNGQQDYELRFLLGKSNPRFGYVGLELAYRFRAGKPSDEYRYLLEYGVSFSKNMYFRAKLDAVTSVKNASLNYYDYGYTSLGPEYDLGRFELIGGWDFSGTAANQIHKWSLELGFAKEIYGDSALKGGELQISLVRAF